MRRLFFANFFAECLVMWINCRMFVVLIQTPNTIDMKHHFKTTNIRGKEYVQVNERLLFFRTDSRFDGWALLSEVLSMNADECTVKATILDATGKPIANGLAHETRQASSINKTSMLENCETSAWGRALGNLGIGIETSIATAEEVEQAVAVQNAPQLTPNTPPPSNKGKTSYYEAIYNELNNGTDKQKALIAKLLQSSAFTKQQRREYLDLLNITIDKEQFSMIIDDIKADLDKTKKAQQ